MSEKLMLAAVGDVSGKVRGKGFPVAARESRFRNGVGWTPTNVQITCFDAIAPSPYGSLGDLILKPAPETEVAVQIGTDRPEEHFVLGDIQYTDGRVWECCLRSMTKSAVEDFRRETGLRTFAAFEHEFMFKNGEASGGAFTLSGFRDGKAYGQLLMGALREAGLPPDTFLREFGPNQYEITLDPAEGVAAADHAVILRELAYAAADAMDRRITFSPLISPTSVGNGVHVHISFRDESNKPATYGPGQPSDLSPKAGAFVAGILKYLDSFVALVAPSVISYTRLTPHRWSAAFNNLGYRDREAAIRICPVTAQDEEGKARQFHFEFRAADAAANPHLVLAVLMRAGLQGVRENLQAPAPTVEDLAELTPEQLAERNVVRLPTTLEEALGRLERNEVVRSWFPEGFVDIYLAHKRGEIAYLQNRTEEEVYAAYSDAY
jgi:glutamine synthetase